MRRKTLPCTEEDEEEEEEEEALFYFIIISNLSFTHYPIQPLSFSFPNFMVAHGVGVAQAKHACKHTIATRKWYQYNNRTRWNGASLYSTTSRFLQILVTSNSE